MPRTLLADPSEYAEALANAGFDHARAVTEPHGTMVMPLASDAPEARADADVRALRVLAGPGANPAELELHDAIARGGMGQIRLADQLALFRTVAVKCAVKGSRDRHEVADELLREARVTGALEHPNIVPIHTLGRTEDGEVLLVMKRIEGKSWHEVLRTRTSLADDLERHIDVLCDVCRAVHFAHTRGVIHRDLKPQNVMLGSFGEVYVLDWGLAVCIGDARMAGVRHATELTSVAGTPAYMAPEMCTPGEPLDARTDQFLLGGVLHVILAGAPPNTRAHLPDALHAAHLAPTPVFPADVPTELADICRRALARAPADRFGSVEELRLALRAFSRHATARVIVREAQERLRALEGMLARAASDDADDLAAHRAFTESRFGFEQALRAWPESADARIGLRAAMIGMARYEIARAHLDAADVMMREVDAPPDDLVDAHARLRAVVAQALADKADLDAMAREHDVRPGQRQRTRILAACVGAWGVFCAVMSVLSRRGIAEVTVPALVIAQLVMIAMIVVGFRVLGGVIGATKAGRNVVLSGGITLSSVALLWIAVGVTDAPLALGFGMALVMLGSVTAVGSLFLHTRTWIAALVFAAGFPVVMAVPAFALEVNAVFSFLGLFAMAWLWRDAHGLAGGAR